MDFDYRKAFGAEPPEAYERLLLDAMKGDATLFARGDWVELSWELLEPVVQAWGKGDPRKFPNYEAGTWGPAEADTLARARGPGLETPLGSLDHPAPQPCPLPHDGRKGRARGGRSGLAGRGNGSGAERRRGLRGAAHVLGRRELHPGVVNALVDQDLQRVTRLLVNLRGTLA